MVGRDVKLALPKTSMAMDTWHSGRRGGRVRTPRSVAKLAV